MKTFGLYTNVNVIIIIIIIIIIVVVVVYARLTTGEQKPRWRRRKERNFGRGSSPKKFLKSF